MITNVVKQSASANGATVYEIDTTKLKFKILWCNACNKCKESLDYKCIFKDELSEKVTELIESDCIVFCTPVYSFSCTAPMKCFIDKMHSLSHLINDSDPGDPNNFTSKLNGEKVVLLATGIGIIENNIEILESQFKAFANFLKCEFDSSLFPNTPHRSGAILEEDSNVKKAKELGKKLADISPAE